VLLVDASGLGTSGRSTHELSESDIGRLAELMRRWRRDKKLQVAGDLMAIAVDVDDLVAAGSDLTPRRYFPVAQSVGVDDLRSERRRALMQAREAADELDLLLDSLTEVAGAAQTVVPARRRLGDVAEVFKPRITKDAGQVVRAQAGDLMIATTGAGFAVHKLSEGDPISGLHAIVIRAAASGQVLPSWLLLWTRTEAFAGLVDRYAKGATIRSLSVKDLQIFELDVPSVEVQVQSEELLDHLDRLTAIQESIASSVERLRSAELRLAYAEATQ
jgi:hypothetical protein